MTPPAENTASAVLYGPRLIARTRATGRIQPQLKRTFDITLAALLLLAVLPLMLVIALAIKLDTSGPVFFRVRRVGYRGKPMWMLKFRKMHDDATGGPLTVHGDPRLTRIGSFLTQTRLDELPQLWDVFRGRMSIVGPRPEDPRFVALHRRAYEHILSVRPGLTGITQLAFADESEILDPEDPVGDYVTRLLPSKIELDRLYADTRRFGLDLAVLCWTLVAVLGGRAVAVHRDSGRMCLRRRSDAILDEPVTVGEAPMVGEPAIMSEAA
jgi:lipopolysaccharide/colanic/teichoic acid biosynthesis glycosyltransferase